MPYGFVGSNFDLKSYSVRTVPALCSLPLVAFKPFKQFNPFKSFERSAAIEQSEAIQRLELGLTPMLSALRLSSGKRRTER